MSSNAWDRMSRNPAKSSAVLNPLAGQGQGASNYEFGQYIIAIISGSVERSWPLHKCWLALALAWCEGLRFGQPSRGRLGLVPVVERIRWPVVGEIYLENGDAVRDS